MAEIWQRIVSLRDQEHSDDLQDIAFRIERVKNGVAKIESVFIDLAEEVPWIRDVSHKVVRIPNAREIGTTVELRWGEKLKTSAEDEILLVDASFRNFLRRDMPKYIRPVDYSYIYAAVDPENIIFNSRKIGEANSVSTEDFLRSGDNIIIGQLSEALDHPKVRMEEYKLTMKGYQDTFFSKLA